MTYRPISGVVVIVQLFATQLVRTQAISQQTQMCYVRKLVANNQQYYVKIIQVESSGQEKKWNVAIFIKKLVNWNYNRNRLYRS